MSGEQNELFTNNRNYCDDVIIFDDMEKKELISGKESLINADLGIAEFLNIPTSFNCENEKSFSCIDDANQEKKYDFLSDSTSQSFMSHDFKDYSKFIIVEYTPPPLYGYVLPSIQLKLPPPPSPPLPLVSITKLTPPPFPPLPNSSVLLNLYKTYNHGINLKELSSLLKMEKSSEKDIQIQNKLDVNPIHNSNDGSFKSNFPMSHPIDLTLTPPESAVDNKCVYSPTLSWSFHSYSPTSVSSKITSPIPLSTEVTTPPLLEEDFNHLTLSLGHNFLEEKQKVFFFLKKKKKLLLLFCCVCIVVVKYLHASY
jgi:hypothetical protein